MLNYPKCNPVFLRSADIAPFGTNCTLPSHLSSPLKLSPPEWKDWKGKICLSCSAADQEKTLSKTVIWPPLAGVFEGDVKKNLLERTEAEKVFRPWWDTLEDYLLNILIIIGGTKGGEWIYIWSTEVGRNYPSQDILYYLSNFLFGNKTVNNRSSFACW